MDLREATAVVLADALENNNGNISFEVLDDMSKARKKRLVLEMMESDEMLQEVSTALEEIIAEHLDNYADEYGLAYWNFIVKQTFYMEKGMGYYEYRKRN